MDLSVLKKRSAFALAGLLTLTVGAGTMHATVLSASATATTALTAPGVTCNTLNGPPSSGQTITVHAFPAPAVGTTIAVGVVQIAGLKITPPSAVLLTSTTNTAGLVFTVNSLPGCQGLTTSNSGVNSITPQFTTQTTVGSGAPGSVVNDVTATVTATLTATTSALAAAPVTITCAYNSTGPVYVPGAPKMVSVTSAANGGTPFTVSTGSLPSWLVLGPAAPGGTAGTSPVNFTVQAAAGCGAFAGTTQTYALPLTNAPAPAQTVTISLVSSTVSPLTVTPVPAAPTISMSYVKSSGAAAVANVNVTSSVPSVFFTVNTSTLPIWLTVNVTGAVVPSGGKAMQFSTTTAADSLAPGTYTATVFLQVSGAGDYPVTITLLVANKPPKLEITSANPMAVTYTLGGSVPVTTITVASTDSPIPYTISLGGALAPQLTGSEQLTGIAYSFGSNINVTYNPLLFETSAPGTVLTGTVTFTWGSPASVVVVTINLTVGSPAATLTSISPATLPTAAPGTTFYVTLTGSGFVGGSDPTQATRVGLVSGVSPGTINLDTNITVSSVSNASNMIVKIVVPATADPNLPFAVGGAGGPVPLGIVNGASPIPTGTATLTIGSLPIIYGVTSSSSFAEVSGGNLPQIAPYDMISIFGANFCSAGTVATNCSTTTILAGSPDPATLRFPFNLSPDLLPTPPAADTRRQLAVTFYPHGTLTGGLPAPLLFATNGQINAIVPGAVTTTSGTIYDVVVSFGCPALSGSVGCTPSTVANSIAFPVNTVAVDPGVFTVGSDGQGQAAALASGTYALIGASNPAGMRNGATSDVVQIYMTGLGVPGTGVAVNAGSGCVGVVPYEGALNTSVTPNLSLTTIDGDVLQTILFPGEFPPCLTTEPTATVGGVAATIGYAAFVGDTVAGLYQINLTLPSATNTFYPNYPSHTGAITNLTAATQLPVFVTLGGVTSQAGVMLSVAPKLLMTPPTFTSGTTINLSIGHAYSDTITGSNNGSHTGVTYAVTSGILPKGLALTTSGGVGTISGTPAQGTAGSYTVTITATDSSAIPVTGSSTFTYYVPGGLFVTHGSITTSTYGTANNAIATVTAVGGTAPYNNFAITSVPTLTGMSVTSGGVVQTDGTTPAGIYLITVTATDAAGLTGTVSFSFTVNVELTIAPSPPTTVAASSSTTITTVTAHGGSGPYTYSLDPSNTSNALLLSLDPATGILTAGTAADTTPTMSVIIDVVDTGAPATGATSVAPGTITITVTISG